MTTFILGLFVGCLLGMIVMSLCSVSKRSDEAAEHVLPSDGEKETTRWTDGSKSSSNAPAQLSPAYSYCPHWPSPPPYRPRPRREAFRLDSQPRKC